MREEEKESWEKEFDGLFFPEIGSTKTELQRHSARKDFIRDLLSSQRAELLEKLPKEHTKDEPRAWGFRRVKWMDEGFNLCLSEVKKIIGGSDE